MLLSPPPHAIIHNAHLEYRPDIDGLRALAILAVVIFHTFPNYLPGGFVGVDIFFVISGYLITSIILKAQSGDGFSLSEFYSRRIKRIFPALIVVLGFCLAVGWLVLLADEYKELGKHVAAGAIYVSNFILKGESGYFDTAAELKPLLHLWSLGIEEQFYLIWPLLLIVGLRANLNPLAIIIFVFIISFSLNVTYIERLPTHVFYLPISRAWELLIGSTLGYINLYKRHAFDRIASRILLRNPHQTGNHLANIFAWAGVTLIALAMVGLSKSRGFPGWWALIPTIGAVFLIAAGDRSWLNRTILARKPVVYIGLISYPLYLWHWPLLSFARIIENDNPSVLIRSGVIVTSILLAWGTYWLIEKRFRFRQQRFVATGLFVTLGIVGGLGYQVYLQAGYGDRHPHAEHIAENFAWDKQGLNRQSPCTEKFGQEFQQYCEINEITESPTILLVGDSNANHFYPGLAQTYAKSGDNLLNLGQGACPPFFGTNVTFEDGNLHCEKTIDKALEYAIESKSVKTVVLSMRPYIAPQKNQTYIINYPHNPIITAPLEILEDAMRITLRRLTAAEKQVVFILGIPRLDFDPALCVDDRPWRLTPVKLKKPCAIHQEEDDKLSRGYRSMVKHVLQDFPQVRLWDSTLEMCDGEYCWAMKDGILLYRDTVHLSVAGSLFMGARLPLQDIRTH